MLSFLWDLASFIVALGVLITVHEFGHFWLPGVVVFALSVSQ